MIFFKKPQEFKAQFEVVGVFCQRDNEMLLLKRHEQKPQGGTWCVPGGKIHAGETPQIAAVREMSEEVGLAVSAGSLMYVGMVFVKYPEYDFVYHMYKTVFAHEQAATITLKSDEHTEYKWLTPEDALKENLIQDEDACIKICFSL